MLFRSKESEGLTKEEAMTLDARLNIRDNQGTVKDYAKYFQYAGISKAEAQSEDLLRDAKGEAGWIIGTQGSQEIHDLHANERITDAAATALARTAPNNAALQSAGANQIMNVCRLMLP